MNHQHAILHLSLINGVGPITIQKIIAHIPATYAWHDIYLFSIHDWMKLGIMPSTAEALCKGLQDRMMLEKELALMQKHTISLVTIIDESYPHYLRSIYAPPPIIYYQGTIPPARHIAFVGSRQANHYGKKIIEQLIPPLVFHNMTIVSGGAIGADSMAHRTTIDAGGKTIVVLGSGLLKLYPYQNKKLFEDTLVQGGALISPFALQTDPLPGNFVARNRVIAGLAHGVVVVQAAQKSGTRSTAQFALEQGRDVFAIPGAFDDPLSAGCHALIKEGAKLIINAQDILEEYGIEFLQKSESSVQWLKSLQETKAGYPIRSIQERIIAVCTSPQSVDEIAVKTEKSLKELQLILFEMQMAGLVEQDFAGLWKAI